MVHRAGDPDVVVRDEHETVSDISVAGQAVGISAVFLEPGALAFEVSEPLLSRFCLHLFQWLEGRQAKLSEA